MSYGLVIKPRQSDQYVFGVLSVNRCHNCSLDVPMILEKSLPQVKSGYACLVCPFLNSKSFSLKSNLGFIPSILRLFFSCSPSAIFFTIMTVIIYAFNSCIKLSVNFDRFFIRRIHIVLELIKGLPKTFYSSSSIKYKTTIPCFTANSINSHPNCIKRSSRKSMTNFYSTSTTTSGTVNLFWLSRFIKRFTTIFTEFHNRILSNIYINVYA